MQTNDNESVWISQKMYTYQDPGSTVQLLMNFEIGIFPEDKWNSYCSPRVALLLRDKRIHNQKVQIELHYAELNELVVKIEKAKDKGLENVFRAGASIHVVKFYSQNRKDLVLTLGVENNVPTILIKITDPTSSSGSNSSIKMDFQAFSCVYNFCKQARDNYIVTTSTFLNIAMQERILKQFSSMNESLGLLRAQMKAMSTTHTEKEEVIAEEDGADNILDMTASMQAQFDSLIDIDSQTVEGIDDLSDIVPTKPKDIGGLSFIGNMLGYDFMKFCEWVSAFLCANDTASETTFCPLNAVMIQSTMNPKFPIDNPKWLEAQYFMTVMMRKSIKTYLKTKKFETFPVFVLPSSFSFKKGSEEFEIAKEVMFTLLVSTLTTSNYVKYLRAANIDESSATEMIVTAHFLAKYLKSLMMSIDFEGLKEGELKEELLDVLKQCYSNGFLDKLNDLYSGWTAGGNIDFSQKVMDTVIDKFILSLDKVLVFTVSETEEERKARYEKYLVHDFGQITTESEVKICVLKELGFLNEAEPTCEPRLKLFLECSKKYFTPLLKEEVSLTCVAYNDLEKIFREKNIPTEIIRIKRVMDKNPDVERRSDVLKLVKELSEDPSVSETRTMFESQITEDEEPLSEDLEEILFGMEDKE